jgi:hypothetical protein
MCPEILDLSQLRLRVHRCNHRQTSLSRNLLLNNLLRPSND